jgi:hypothetical protein
MTQESVFVNCTEDESARERIPRGLPLGIRTKTTGFVPLKDRRYSAACRGESSIVVMAIDPFEYM